MYKAWKQSEAPSLSGAVLPTSGGVGRRREKIKDKVEKMSIMTGVIDKDVVPASKVSLRLELLFTVGY